eukprot:scaffold4719_cov76-Amphora_coffeaeformis.AAC.1
MLTFSSGSTTCASSLVALPLLDLFSAGFWDRETKSTLTIRTTRTLPNSNQCGHAGKKQTTNNKKRLLASARANPRNPADETTTARRSGVCLALRTQNF